MGCYYRHCESEVDHVDFKTGFANRALKKKGAIQLYLQESEYPTCKQHCMKGRVDRHESLRKES